jgi:hypothetical protein
MCRASAVCQAGDNLRVTPNNLTPFPVLSPTSTMKVLLEKLSLSRSLHLRGRGKYLGKK